MKRKMILRWVGMQAAVLALCSGLVGCGAQETAEAKNEKNQPQQEKGEYAVLKEAIEYAADGTETGRAVVEVDEDGFPVFIANKDADGTIFASQEIRYHENGSIAYARESNETGYTEYEHDDGGKLLKTTFFQDDIEYRHFEYEYDDRGNVLLFTAFMDGREAGSAECEYDADGKLLKQTGFEDGKEYYRYEYEYDAAGNLRKQTGFEYGAEVDYTEFEYDDSGNLLKETYFYEGTENGYAEYEYDDHGNLLTKTSFYDGKESYRYEYGYDGRGNRLKESCFYEGELRSYTVYTWQENTVLISSKDVECIEENHFNQFFHQLFWEK